MDAQNSAIQELVKQFRYRPAKGLWVVTAYYNPCGYETRRFNYEVFSQTLKRSGIPLITVECAFDQQPFNLPDSSDVIKVRSKSLLWQKERLLNLATSWLPDSARGVAWLDCDLLFTNPNWAIDTMQLLEDQPLLQVFESCNRLPEEGVTAQEQGDVCESFAVVAPYDLEILRNGRYDQHGHTGYGWVARRSLLQRHGLYEAAIAGSADSYMAHAALGDFDSLNIRRVMNNNANLLQHFSDWAQSFFESVQGRVGAVPGQVLHLWHGDLANRQYMARHIELARHDFNPFTDLVVTPGKPLEWNPAMRKPGLVDMFSQYFASRNEDGHMAQTA